MKLQQIKLELEKQGYLPIIQNSGKQEILLFSRSDENGLSLLNTISNIATDGNKFTFTYFIKQEPNVKEFDSIDQLMKSVAEAMSLK